MTNVFDDDYKRADSYYVKNRNPHVMVRDNDTVTPSHCKEIYISSSGWKLGTFSV